MSLVGGTFRVSRPVRSCVCSDRRGGRRTRGCERSAGDRPGDEPRDQRLSVRGMTMTQSQAGKTSRAIVMIALGLRHGCRKAPARQESALGMPRTTWQMPLVLWVGFPCPGVEFCRRGCPPARRINATRPVARPRARAPSRNVLGSGTCGRRAHSMTTVRPRGKEFPDRVSTAAPSIFPRLSSSYRSRERAFSHSSGAKWPRPLGRGGPILSPLGRSALEVPGVPRPPPRPRGKGHPGAAGR